MGLSHTILIVEDDRQLQAALKRVAESLGHRLIQTTSGRSVRALALEHRPDLIVLDLTLGDADGRDVLAQLKANESTRAIPVLVWSGRTDSDSKRIALELGADDYVEKFDAYTLLRKVERVLLHTLGPGVSGSRLLAAEPWVDSERAGKRTG